MRQKCLGFSVFWVGGVGIEPSKAPFEAFSGSLEVYLQSPL